jgi:hypothetical protein
MNAEFVKISRPELVFGETSLLKSQMSLLNLKKHYSAYKELRKKELLLKIELKKSTSEANENLALLDKLLPHTRLKEEQKEEENLKKELVKSIQKAVEREKPARKPSSIEDELAEIQKKRAALQ